MAWMTREDASLYSSVPKEPDMDTLTYWMARLEPLIRAENQEEIIVIFCNRTGMERDTVYAGTSTVVGIKDGEVNVYGLLGRGEEELLIVDTMSPPIAKLVYAPGDQGPTAVPIPESPSGAEDTSPLHQNAHPQHIRRQTIASTEHHKGVLPKIRRRWKGLGLLTGRVH